MFNVELMIALYFSLLSFPVLHNFFVLPGVNDCSVSHICLIPAPYPVFVSNLSLNSLYCPCFFPFSVNFFPLCSSMLAVVSVLFSRGTDTLSCPGNPGPAAQPSWGLPHGPLSTICPSGPLCPAALEE